MNLLITYISMYEGSFDLVTHVAQSDTLGDAGNVLSQSFPGCLNFGISILRRS